MQTAQAPLGAAQPHITLAKIDRDIVSILSDWAFASPATIDDLNQRALKLAGPNHTGNAGRRALRKVVEQENMEVIREDKTRGRGGKWVIAYKLPDGHMVTCWMTGCISDTLGPGGIGFDDQFDWLYR